MHTIEIKKSEASKTFSRRPQVNLLTQKSWIKSKKQMPNGANNYLKLNIK